MIFFESIKLLYAEAFTWKARTSRTHYNYAVLFLIFFSISAVLYEDKYGMDWILVSFFMFIGIPGTSLIVKRMHDINVNAWALIPVYIPIIGELITLSLMWAKTYKGSNKWGPNPLDELEKDSDQPEVNAESIWTKKETINTEQSDENYNNEMEEELQKVEDMYKKKTITSAERKKMRNKILNID